MADNVWFGTTHMDTPMPAGWQYYDPDTGVGRNGTPREYYDTVTVPSNSGFDGFPFAIDWDGEIWDGTFTDKGGTTNTFGNYIPDMAPSHAREGSTLIGPGTACIGPLTLDECIAMYWRVKKWKLDGVNANASASYPAQDLSTIFGTGSPDYPLWFGLRGRSTSANITTGTETYSPYLPSRERDLCYPPRGTGFSAEDSHEVLEGSQTEGTDEYGNEYWTYILAWSYGDVKARIYAALQVGAGVVHEKITGDIISDEYYIPCTASVVASAYAASGFDYGPGGWNSRSKNNSYDMSLLKPAGVECQLSNVPLESISFGPTVTYSDNYATWFDWTGGSTSVEVDGWNDTNSTGEWEAITGSVTLEIPPTGRTLSVPIYGWRHAETTHMKYGAYGTGYYGGTPWQDPSLPTLEAFASGFSASPKEYWPYATKQGAPVWDHNSGAMINPPDS